MFNIKSVDAILAVFNKTIEELKKVEDHHSSVIASNDIVISKVVADSKARDAEKNKAAAVRAKIEKLINA
jgi:hypothetical protein